MNISKKGLDIIKKYEGLRLTAYKCPAGVWTIGYGHTKGVSNGMVITQAQADKYLLEDIAFAEKNVNSFNSKYFWTQNEYDALVSFAFNVGSINQLTANGTRDKKTIGDKILLYNKANGNVLKGLVRRREEEHALYFDSSKTSLPTLKKGSRGESVVALQTYLNLVGFDCGKVDGIYGTKTENAVKDFKKSNIITLDGLHYIVL
jgi:GH24 family phage-related lysozyme (muramidase)